MANMVVLYTSLYRHLALNRKVSPNGVKCTVWGGHACLRCPKLRLALRLLGGFFDARAVHVGCCVAACEFIVCDDVLGYYWTQYGILMRTVAMSCQKEISGSGWQGGVSLGQQVEATHSPKLLMRFSASVLIANVAG